jgi:FkbM family methyltransferase
VNPVRRGLNLVRFARKVSSLGARRRDRLLLGLYALVLPLAARLGWGAKIVRLRIAPNGFIVADRSDYIVLCETLVDRDFDLDLGEPHTIVDLGAHAGAFSLYLHDRYPQASLIAVEPSPTTAARLRHNLAGLADITIVQAAISDRAGMSGFEESAQSWGSALHPTGTVSVRTLPLFDLLRELGVQDICVLKMDIEGAEWDAFPDEASLCGAQHVIGELHSTDKMRPQDFFGRFLSYDATVLRDFGHGQLFHLRRCLIPSQLSHDATSGRALERR